MIREKLIGVEKIMQHIAEKTDLLLHFNNNKELLDYLAEYFHEYANTTFDKELFKLDKDDKKVSLFTRSNKLVAEVQVDGGLRFSIKSQDSETSYGVIKWKFKKYMDLKGKKEITFTNRTLNHILKELK